MGVQAGIWAFDRFSVESDIIGRIDEFTAKQGPDGSSSLSDGPVLMLYRYFHTTKESRRERQPYRTTLGAMVTWDGRLDNRDELISLLLLTSDQYSDAEIVALAFDQFGVNCFQKLKGDWAVAIWSPHQQEMILAKDYIGLRHLYFSRTADRLLWCTDLEALITQSGSQYTLCDEYIAGYLTRSVSSRLTPYQEVHSVRPGTFLRITKQSVVESRYWSFQPRKRIRYRTDSQYEEHFRFLFRQAVCRRLRSDSPILGELSGGIDSSSIICMADLIVAAGEAAPTRLDTLTMYSTRDQGGDERAYSTIIEGKRGRAGHLINRDDFGNPLSPDQTEFDSTPGRLNRGGNLIRALNELTKSHNYRVILSGYAGDELLGGVPNALPLLADLLMRGRLIRFYRDLVAWSLVKKKPLLELLRRSTSLIIPDELIPEKALRGEVAPWISKEFANRFKLGLRQLVPRGRYGFVLQSRIDLARTLVAIGRQVSGFVSHAFDCEEVRYPYLDQDLVEFLVAIPADQVLRPKERRSLMRRSLIGIVPREVLFRKTKGTLSQLPMSQINEAWRDIERLCRSPVCAALGYIDAHSYTSALQSVRHGQSEKLMPLLKTLSLELWLRTVIDTQLIKADRSRLSMVHRDMVCA
jgi:asparagine synthase (glutamine-hydrolysing)